MVYIIQMKAIFIFHRDFRLIDNTSLIAALKESTEVLPIFIFDPRQISSQNSYKSNNCVQFMIQSLTDLDQQLSEKGSRLFLFHGHPPTVLSKLIHSYQAEAVYFNTDYTLFAKNRDQELVAVCQKLKIPCNQLEDYLLQPVASVTTGGGQVYTKFTPYFNKVHSLPVSEVESNKRTNYASNKLKFSGQMDIAELGKYYNNKENPNLLETGGRANALKKLAKIEAFTGYNKERNNPNIPTTQMSAFIKFGCVSIREVYWKFHEKLGNKNDLIKQLYWRDFFYNIAYAYPTIFQGISIKPKYDKIKWHYNSTWFQKWCDGMTGFPMVDAGMRQMNTTGFMHNRLRLVVSNFLVKVLLLDWRLGEKYFAQTLYDYDPSVNNQSWSWSAGSGADSQPYFRVFNPWIQSKTHDPDCQYIKHWIPELSSVPNKHIHQWYKYYSTTESKYPSPIVDYSVQKKMALKLYTDLLS